MQHKINEFCESFNRFTEEYPELRENEQTKEELLSRVDILSKQLWETIKQRKDEGMEERQRLMQGGWASVEMFNLAQYVSKLIENEFNRFSSISTLLSNHILNEEIDLANFCKRLNQKGTEPINKAEDGTCYSPLLDEVAGQVISAVNSLINEPFIQNLEKERLEVLQREHQNFNMRLNLLKVWAVLLLEEISMYSN